MSDVVDLGEWSELTIQEGLNRAFSPDFVFHRPMRNDVKAPEEATDILVLFDDVAIIVESKARALRKGNPWRDSNTNWAAKKIKEACDPQLKRAARLLREGKFGEVENARRKRVKLDPANYPYVYGLIIVNHVSEAYHAKDLVPDLEKSPIPTLVLSLKDLLSLAHYLDTPGDLINYLEARYAIDYHKLQPRVHEEQKGFQYYVNHFEQITAKRFAAMGQPVEEKSLEPQGILWRKCLSGVLEDARHGRFFDLIIDQLHKGSSQLDVAEYNGIKLDYGPTDYAEVATRLAAYGRMRRIGLGKRMVGCIEEAEKVGEDLSFRTYSPGNRVAICFHATHFTEEQRAERAADLIPFTGVVHVSTGAEQTIGIATQAYMRGPRSFDVVLMKFDRSLLPPDKIKEAEDMALDHWGPLTKPLIRELQE